MRLPIAICLACVLPGCLATDLEPGAAGLGGRFDTANDPRLLIGGDVEGHWAALPRVGDVVPSPWPGPWWSYSGDGTAWAWRAGEPSPLEKYGLAMGAAAEAVLPGWTCLPSSSSAAVVCEADLGAHPEHAGRAPNGELIGRLMSGTRTGVVDGDYTGAWRTCEDLSDGVRRCVSRTPEEWELTFHSNNNPEAQGWFGHCDGWAFSSVSEPQPLHPVTVEIAGGVTFEVADIEALLAEVHACDTEGPGLRAGEDPALAAVAVLGEDCGTARRQGPSWAAEAACRDVDPGAFLLVLAEAVGSRGRALYLDGDPGPAVWNYPVAGYEVLADEPASGDEAASIRPEGGSVRRVEIELRLVATVSPRASLPVDADETRRSHTTKKTLSALVALDAWGAVVGGEWVGSSRSTHPDTVKLVRRVEPVPAVLLTQPHCRNPLLSWERIRELVTRSRECLPDHPEWACEPSGEQT